MRFLSLAGLVIAAAAFAAAPPTGSRERPIRVGINRDYPPYEFVNGKGEPDGYDVELLRAVARVMGLEIQIQPGPWDQVRRDLETGTIDLAPGMLKSTDRMRFATFSEPHMVVHYSIFVRKGDLLPRSLEDLRGRKVLVERGSQMHEHLLGQGFESSLVPVASEPEALRALAAGNQDAALAPTLEGLLLIREARLSNLRPAGAPVFSRELCFAMTRGHEDLRAKLDTGLSILHRTGEYEGIYRRWFGALEPKSLTPWQILRTAVWIILPLAALSFAILAWNQTLRRRVRQATAEIQASHQSIQEREALLKAVIDSIPLMLFVKDPNQDFRFTVWNRKTEELLGIPREQILGKTDYDLMDPELVPEFRAADLHVLESGKPLEIPEETVISPSRGPVQLRTTKVPVLGEDGRPRFLLGISEDLSALKHIEAELSRSQASLAEAQRLAHIGSWEWDAASGNFRCSDELLRILGLPPDKAGHVLGALLDQSHPDDRKALESLLSPEGSAGDSGRLDHRILRADGRERILHSRIEVSRDESGLVRRIMGTGQDITEQRTSEEALRQTQRLESLGVLAGGIAHDFNNLLTAILGNLNLAQRTIDETNPAFRYLQKIETTVVRAATLARQMLAYSGRGTFMFKPIDLNRLVREMTHLLEVSLSKKVVLQFALDPFIPAITADESQIQQVVMNLITNASEAIGDKEGLITLSTRMQILDEESLASRFHGQELRCGTFVALEVRDTGCGMSPEVLKRLFEPFFTTKFSGRGLGLSAMLGILKSHKGGIQIESEPGVGSVFRLYFPASEELPLAEPSHQEPNSQPTRPGTILVAEDEPTIRLSTAEMLQDMGYRVLQAADGLAALELFRDNAREISAVILDLTMPRMDGRETLRAMLEIDPSVRVIVCSGYHEQDALQGPEARSVCGFLPKPYRMKDLRTMLERAILR